MKLTKNFTLAELTKSEIALRRGIDNTPPPHIVENLRLLCENILQPVRDHFNAAVTVTSGYRSPDVNSAVGGSRTSDHCKGFAADFEIAGLSNGDLAQWIAENCQFRQLILEFYTPGEPNSGWVHASFNPNDNKCQCLTAMRVNGKVKYENGLLGVQKSPFSL